MVNEYNPLEELYKEDIYHVPPRTTIIIPTSWQELSEADISLLGKILASVRLTLASVQVYSFRTVTFENLMASDVKRVLIFGSQLTPDVEPYKNTRIGAIPVIKADALNKLDDGTKKRLWMALKEMFAP